MHPTDFLKTARWSSGAADTSALWTAFGASMIYEDVRTSVEVLTGVGGVTKQDVQAYEAFGEDARNQNAAVPASNPGNSATFGSLGHGSGSCWLTLTCISSGSAP